MLAKYLFKRTFQSIIILLGVALLVFLFLRIIPGNPVVYMLGEHADAATARKITEKMGLDRPLPVQYFDYVKSIFTGNMGISIIYGRPVSDMIAEAFPNTVKLALAAAVFAWVTGIGTAVYSVIRRHSIPARIFNSFSVLGISLPVFMIAMLLQYFLAFRLAIFPVSSPDITLISLVLPALTLGWSNAGEIYILSKSVLEEALHSDYVIAARAKGADIRHAVIHHALRNSFLPVMTLMSMQLSSLLSGAVITETIFSVNGLGRLAVDAISGRDMPVIQGTVLFATVIVIVFNLLADCLYACVDKRTERRWKY